MLKAGNVERVLVLGILLIIGLILIVAIKGARDLEDDLEADRVAESPSLRSETPPKAGKEERRDSRAPSGKLRGDLSEDLRDAIQQATDKWGPGSIGAGDDGEDPSGPGTGARNPDRPQGGRRQDSPVGPGRLTANGTDPGPTKEPGAEEERGHDPALRGPGTGEDPIEFDLDKSRIAGGSAGPMRLTDPAAGAPKVGADPAGNDKRGTRNGGEVVEPAPKVVPNTGNEWTYVVQTGDILGRIADRLYGTSKAWPDIASANPDVDPNRLKVGATLKLPRAPLSADLPGVTRGAPTKNALAKGTGPVADGGRASVSGTVPRYRRMVKRDTHEVQSGDTLMNIALGTYGTKSAYRMILEANKGVLTDEDHLVQGMVLTLPPN